MEVIKNHKKINSMFSKLLNLKLLQESLLFLLGIKTLKTILKKRKWTKLMWKDLKIALSQM